MMLSRSFGENLFDLSFVEECRNSLIALSEVRLSQYFSAFITRGSLAKSLSLSLILIKSLSYSWQFVHVLVDALSVCQYSAVVGRLISKPL